MMLFVRHGRPPSRPSRRAARKGAPDPTDDRSKRQRSIETMRKASVPARVTAGEPRAVAKPIRLPERVPEPAG
jgi:hypothetical protein